MSTASGTAVSDIPVALPRRKLIFGLIASALVLAAADQTIVATALHAIEQDLGSGLEWTAWIISIYGLGQIIVSPIAGSLAQRWGHKPVYLTSLTIFLVASVLCGFSTNIGMLIGFRALQSIGGGGIVPVSVAIVASHFGPNRDRATGLFTTIFPIGGSIGPLIGSFFASSDMWRWIFFINVPIGLVVVIASAFLLPRGRVTDSRFSTDPTGIVLLIVTVIALMLAITALGSPDVAVWDWRVVVPGIVCVAVAGLFVRHLSGASRPLIPIRLIKGRTFGALNLVNFIAGAAGVGLATVIPLSAQDRFGIAALPSGLLLSVRSIGMISVAAAATFLLRRTGYRLPMVIGPILGAIGFAGTALVPSFAEPFVWLMIAGGVFGIGQGIYLPASNNASLQLAPDDISAIAGVRGMFRQIGTISAVSIATAVIARADDPTGAFVGIFLAGAVAMLLIVPLAFTIPDHKGRW